MFRLFAVSSFVALLVLSHRAFVGAGEKKAVAAFPPKAATPWKSLFDGKTLTGWKKTNFGGEGEVEVEKGLLILDRGSDMTGVTYDKNDFPKMNFEFVIDAKKINGGDFFCTATFPVGKDFCSFVVGGWGGSTVGLSSLDTRDASENETTQYQDFKKETWYKIRVRVTEKKIQTWIDDKSMVDVSTEGKKISTRIECDLCKPFGICTWRTTGAIRSIHVRELSKDEIAKVK